MHLARALMRYLLPWAIGVVVIAGSIAVGAACADWHVVWRIAIGIVMCACGIALGARTAVASMGMVLGLVCFVVVMAQPTDLLRTHFGEHVTIPVAAARDHGSASTFHFTDGELATRHIGAALTYSAGKVSSSKYLTCVTPIVAAGDEVAAWALIEIEGLTICQRDYFAELDMTWKQGRREGVRVDRIERTDAEKAVADVLARDRLTVSPGAPIVALVSEGLTARAARAERNTLWWLVWTSGLWTLAIAALAIRRKLARAR